ncbi:oxidoreductase [Burkholderia sp. Cy-637]|uniref:oxidoreductase n=1 Tax=Burkholderia sp. Cy-637 TaxID=2608327 RepID=UPI001422CD1D|nr:SDR family NAD(P)-dependent oxidoreductase [Burkholderia sp. Cy-637]
MKSSSTQKVFLITGVNSGLGRAFADAALAAGHKVIGTVRSETARAEFELRDRERAFGLVLDVTEYDRVAAAIGEVTLESGPVEVLVNNAGYGHEGVLEESPLDELQAQFAVNVFGAVAMIKAVLPSMRERRRGHIVNVTSLVGSLSYPGIAYYSGSKFALEGISESLAQEVEAFGIHVTALAPGSFRTDWAGRSLVRTGRSIADYDAVFDPVRQARQAKDGRQIGDPAQAARVLLELVEHEAPPRQLLLGSDALVAGQARIEARSASIDA